MKPPRYPCLEQEKIWRMERVERVALERYTTWHLSIIEATDAVAFDVLGTWSSFLSTCLRWFLHFWPRHCRTLRSLFVFLLLMIDLSRCWYSFWQEFLCLWFISLIFCMVDIIAFSFFFSFFGKFRYSRYCRQIEKLEMKILFSFHRVSNILCRDFTKDEDSCKVATWFR